MKKFSLIYPPLILLLTLVIFSIVSLLTGCKKDDPQPTIPIELVPKQLDSITQNGKLIYKFNYENDTLVEYIFYGEPFQRAEFRNGLIYRYYNASGNYVEYYKQSGFVRASPSYDMTRILESHLTNKGRITMSYFYPNDSARIEYRYGYNQDNITIIKVSHRNGGSTSSKIYYLTYDNSPNPWQGMGLINDYTTFSKNNYLEINSFPYASYTYDDQGYMIESDIYKTGIYQYHYK